jgi:RimJ/RimL family protein N-acetyltransferase
VSIFLETERLVLRDREPRDLEFLASLYADPQVMRYIGDGRTYELAEVEARYARVDATIAGGERERWNEFKMVERRDDGAALGHAGLLRCEIDGVPEVEVGWWLAPFSWGYGYATEAALALRDFAFGELGLDRLSVVLQAENARSVAVARRIGGELARPAEYRGQRVTRYVVRPQPSLGGA